MTRYDVAIIGGGVIGWSCAYHLVKRKPGLRVAVLERCASCGRGSTGRAAGGVRAQFGTAVNVQLSLASIRAFERFQDEVGAEVEFRQAGYLFVTATEKGAEHLRRVVPMQQELGVPVECLDGPGIHDRASYLYADDLLSGAFSPADGYLDPHAVCAGYEGAARRLGVVPLYSTEVASLDDDGALVVAPAETGNRESPSPAARGSVGEGVVRANEIVVASGHWSGDLARRLGLELPIEQEIHYLAVTEPFEGLPDLVPMVVDLDTGFHFRREGAGLLVGCKFRSVGGRFTGGSVPGSPVGAAASSALDLRADPPFDNAFLERLAEVGPPRLPLLSEARFDTRKGWAGYYAETPDGHAIIGRIGDFIIATGFGGHGVMHSPAAGQAVAEIILDGECSSFNIRPLRPQRFAEGDLIRETMVL
ncbi:MAG: FAD-binding oxidoreductase [Armatimonadetes bacterium]|nr:FAD-binding oxidoreductase [Armatimonadota bacterium]